MIDAVNPPQQPLPNQNLYMQPGLDPRQQSYANEYQARYGTALDPSYFTSGGFERDYPTQAPAAPPSGDTLTPADRAISRGTGDQSGMTPAQQTYYREFTARYGYAPTMADINQAFAAPQAAPPSGGRGSNIPDYARPYHTGDVAHTPWLPGQVGWLSEGNYWYPDFGPNIPTQTFTSYPAQSPVPGAPSSGGSGYGPGGYPSGGGGGGGDYGYGTPGYAPGGGLAPGGSGSGGSDFAGGGGIVFNPGPPTGITITPITGP